MPSKRKICVVTGTRAEYGLLRHLIKLIDDSNEFELQLIVTGSHLSKKFGETYKEIETFNENVRNIIVNNEFDSLIYFVSCHGDKDNVIYDSEGDEYQLDCVFYMFNNLYCRQLRNKPKIFVVDAWYGQFINLFEYCLVF